MKFNTPLSSIFLTYGTSPCPITYEIRSVTANNLGTSFAKIEEGYLYFSTTELKQVSISVAALN